MRKSSICFTIKHLNNSLMRNSLRRFPGNPDRPDKRHMIEGWVIDYLYDHRDSVVYQKDLEAGYQVPKSTVATVLKRMEKKGILRRTPDQRDSRLRILTLSEKGENIYQMVSQAILEVDQVMCEGVGEEELQIFLSVADKLTHNLETNMKGRDCGL